jgi:RimJ/RimL family protein N-acetyltransferase
MIPGSGVGLRALEEEDLPRLRDWRNRPHYKKFFREYRELNMSSQRKWFESVVNSDHATVMFGIVEIETTELVGVCGLCYINWVHRHADLSLYIGKDDLYIDTGSDGFSWRALDVLFRHAFDELNLHKVWSEIYDFDAKKHELFSRYGFHQDATLRDNCFFGGRYHDSHVFSLLSEEWRGRDR